jgi:DNA-directed RNA polymerase subunit omega
LSTTTVNTVDPKVGNRYSLVVLAAKRAKQIKEGAPLLIETESTNPLTVALEEIAAGKVTAYLEDALVVKPDADSGPEPDFGDPPAITDNALTDSQGDREPTL